MPAKQSSQLAAGALAASDLHVHLGGKHILRSVDVSVAHGQWLVIVGPNGAGKSTLLRALLGLVRHEGTVELAGRATSSLSVRQRAEIVAYVPQNALIPSGIRVLDYVLLGRTPHLGRGLALSPSDTVIAQEALERLGLAQLWDRNMVSLSGGERQLAVIARALTQQAHILILDEPTTALDIGHQQQVLSAVSELRADLGITVLATLHDLSLAARWGTDLLMLVEGRVVAAGQASEVITADLISKHYGTEVELIEHNGQTVVLPR